MLITTTYNIMRYACKDYIGLRWITMLQHLADLAEPILSNQRLRLP